MERGTDRERDAVRRRWQSMEAQRRATDRLLGGLVAVLFGLVLLSVAVAREACGFTIGGATRDCAAVAVTPTVLAIGLLGALAIGFGVRQCWRATRG